MVAQVPEEIAIPCDFKYIPVRTESKVLTLNYHESEVTFVKMRLESKKPSIFGSNRKLKDRITTEMMKTSWKEKVPGILIHNPTRDYMRIKWEYGTSYIRPSESSWLWADTIDKIWVTDRELDWPKWTLYN